VRALKLGFRELLFSGPALPAVCHDGQRSYVWAVLDPAAAIGPSENAVRIEVPAGGVPAASRTRPHKQPQRKTFMSEPSPNANGHAAKAHANSNSPARKTNGAAEARSGDTLIEQAENLRDALRNLTLQANELVKSLKQHRRQNRAVQQTIASLRQLKTLGV